MNNASAKVLGLEGALTIDRAAGLKEELALAISSSSLVLVDLSSAEDIDLACLQAIYAAAADSRGRGGRLGFRGRLSPRIAKRLAACGFTRCQFERAEGLEDELAGFPGAGA